MKTSFDHFQKQNWILQTVRVENVDEKNGFVCLASIFPCEVAVLKLSKKVYFLQFCTVLSKKPESVKTTCIYTSESSHYTLSEKYMVYRVLRHRS